MLDPYVAYLENRWEEGCRNAKTLWQELVEQGYKGGYRTVRQWAAPRREKPGRLHSKREKNRIEWQQAELARLENELGAVQVNAVTLSETEEAKPVEENVVMPTKAIPAARHLAWLLIRPIEKLSVEELEILSFMRQEGAIELAYEQSQHFLRMLKERAKHELELWIARCEVSGVVELANFGAGLRREVEAIRAAISLPYSNGPTEGQVNKLKMIKRTLYGRGSFEVLRRRVLLAA